MIHTIKSILLSITFMLVIGRGNAQSLNLADIVFENPVEKEVFLSLGNASQQAVDLFVVIDPGTEQKQIVNAKQFIEGIVAEVRNPIAERKTMGKKLEYLQKVLHEKYLLKYQFIVDFPTLIDSGTYNCVTGTALYAFVLEKLGIEFQVYERPNHVYLTAGTEATIIESTDPKKGVFMPSDRLQKAIARSLIASDLASEQEIAEKSASSLFLDVYLKDEKITIQQLAGLHYKNDALLALEAGEWARARQQSLKSLFLYPCEQNEMVVFIANLMDLAFGEIKGIDRVKVAILIVQYRSDLIRSKEAFAILRSELEEFVNQNYSEDDWDQLEPVLRTMQSDTLIYREAQFRMLGERYDKSWNSDRVGAYGIAQQLYQLKPWHGQVRNSLVASFVFQFARNNDYLACLDSMDVFAAKYPFVKAMDNFNSTYLVLIMAIAGSKFEADEREVGQRFLTRFEQQQLAKPGIDMSDVIGSVYACAVRSYIRMADYKMAKLCLTKGLEMAPYSDDINSCKRSFGKELGLD